MVKEEFRKTLAEFITNEKPPYPLKVFDKKVVKKFVNYKEWRLYKIHIYSNQIMLWKNMMITNIIQRLWFRFD